MPHFCKIEPPRSQSLIPSQTCHFERNPEIPLHHVSSRKWGIVSNHHASLTSDSLQSELSNLKSLSSNLPPVPLKEISGIHLIPHIIQHFIVAVGDDGLALLFELLHIIHHAAAEEGAAVLQGGFIDDDFRTLGLNPLHDSLDAALTEIIGIRFHGEAVHADGHGLFPGRIITAAIMIIPCLCQHPISDEILSCAVQFHNGLNQILRYILVIGQELLRILRQAVAAIAEGEIIT